MGDHDGSGESPVFLAQADRLSGVLNDHIAYPTMKSVQHVQTMKGCIIRSTLVGKRTRVYLQTLLLEPRLASYIRSPEQDIRWVGNRHQRGCDMHADKRFIRALL